MEKRDKEAEKEKQGILMSQINWNRSWIKNMKGKREKSGKTSLHRKKE